MRAFAAAFLIAATAAACNSPQQSRCERVCAREEECATEEKDSTNDVGECIDECTRLERDPQLVSSVDSHVACVDSARSCAVVLSCP